MRSCAATCATSPTTPPSWPSGTASARWSDILTVNATLVSQAQNAELKALSESTYDQNEQVKRMSAWAAILFAPTVIGTIYGMNFANMPGLNEPWGFALSLGLMLGVSALLLVIFRRRSWL